MVMPPRRAGVRQHTCRRNRCGAVAVGQGSEQTEQNAEVTYPACTTVSAAAVLPCALKSGDGNSQPKIMDALIYGVMIAKMVARDRPPPEHIQITKIEPQFILLKVLRQSKVSNWNWNGRTKAEDCDDEQSAQHFLVQFRA